MFQSLSSYGQQQVQSQYRGNQKQFQPTGPVQSFYKGNPSAQQSTYGAVNPQTQSYHASNYVGNQPGHDASLRSDSRSPSSYTAAANQSVTSFSNTRPAFQAGAQASSPAGSFQGRTTNAFAAGRASGATAGQPYRSF